MTMISELKELFGEWIAAVARAINLIASRFVPQRQILLIEGDGNTFTAKTASVKKAAALPDVSFRVSNGRPDPFLPADWEATLRGSRVEFLLKSDRVLFRSIDFPRQAADFLDGMIRTQIDRLTPWSANDAVFGWGQPANIANERIQLTLAATSKDKIQPLVQLASNLGAASITAFADRADIGRTAPSAHHLVKHRSRSRGLSGVCGLCGGHVRCRAAATVASDRGTSCVAAPRPDRRRGIGPEPADEAQTDDAVERHGA
jgi:general secretion pathway protein L